MLNKINISPGRQKLIVYLVLTVLTCAVFWQVHKFNFTNFDDPVYVTENAHLRSGLTAEGISWAFSTTYAEFWHPLTWLSFLFDYQLYGLNAGGYHITNVILHILSTLLIFWLFNRMTGAIWKSAFVAAFFALHPLRVESVAWIAERKDVLSVFLGMLTLCLYVCYTEKPAIKRYMLVVFSFICALMSKPVVVTLPVVMILLDYWPLGRFQPDKIAETQTPGIQVHAKKEKQKTGKKELKKNVSPSNNRKLPKNKIAEIIPLWLLWEKTPLFILSAVFSIITIYAQRPMFTDEHSVAARFANAPVSFVKYLENTFWPHNLAVFYPFSDKLPLWQVFGSTLLIIFISVAVIAAWKRLPYLFIGWLWYAIALMPVIGIIRSTSHSMHDCYTYLPSIGPAVILAWGVPLILPHKKNYKMILFAIAMISLFMLAVLTGQQCRYWENDKALWNHALQVNENNSLAHNNLGIDSSHEGKIDEAIAHFNAAIRITPDFAYAYSNRGNAYVKLHQYELAIEDFNEAIRLKPDYVKAYYNRGTAYAKFNQHQRAIEDYNEAIRLQPDYAQAYSNRGASYISVGQYQQAIKDFDEAVRLNPDYADAYTNRGAVYFILGNIKLACTDVQKACALGFCKSLDSAQDEGFCR